MGGILAIVAVLGALGVSCAAFAMIVNGRGDGVDIMSDYRDIKAAIIEYRKTRLVKEKSLEDVRDFLPREDFDLGRYRISADERHLVVDMTGARCDIDKLLKEAGEGTYYDKKTGVLELALLNVQSSERAKPEASFRIMPEDEIYTTTEVTYDYSDSTAGDSDIVDVKWENNRRRFPRSGLHTVKLKVLDGHGTWSEWSSRTIEVKKMPGLRMLASSPNSVVVVHNDGSVDGIGSNEFGQLGNGMVSPQGRRKISKCVEGVSRAACGEYHTLFLNYDGEVMAAGRNSSGQLGIGNRSDMKTPKLIWGLENVRDISCGDSFSMALKMDGSVYGWGDNENCQLGSDKFISREMPTKVEELEDIVQMSCGSDHVLAIDGAGTVYGWGSNTYGQLGIEGLNTVTRPSMIPVEDARKVVGGRNASFIIKRDGSVWALGHNVKCQLGLKGLKECHRPTLVPGLTDIVDVRMRSYFALALDSEGNVYTWGHYHGLNEPVVEIPRPFKGISGCRWIGTTLQSAYAITSDDKLARWSSSSGTIHVLDMNDGEDVN